MGHVVFAHNNDSGFAKRDPVTVSHLKLFPVRHSDQKGNAFINGRLNLISRHDSLSLSKNRF
jgi:hypothetical protein